jgi:hypothetical protein
MIKLQLSESSLKLSLAICTYFCSSLHEKTIPPVDQLGAMEFLCALLAHLAGVGLVLH